MNDVVSDWDSKEEAAPGKDGGTETAAKQNEAEEMILRRQEEQASEKHRKKGEPVEKPENIQEKLKKVEEESVKKLRANHPRPKENKRNTWEVCFPFYLCSQ